MNVAGCNERLSRLNQREIMIILLKGNTDANVMLVIMEQKAKQKGGKGS